MMMTMPPPPLLLGVTLVRRWPVGQCCTESRCENIRYMTVQAVLECWSSAAERLFLALSEIVRTLVRRLSALRAHLSLLSSCDGDPRLSQPQRSSILLVCCAALFLAVLDRLMCSARMASRAWRAGTTENLQ